jgi:hypothetical protein
MRRSLTSGLIGATAVAAALIATTSPAYAAGPGGAEACPSGNFCLYYNSPNAWGSFEHWSPGSYCDLSQFRFRDWGNGSGYNQTVYENAAAVVNNTSYSWNICVPAPPPDNLNCGIPIAQQYSGRLPDAAYNKAIAMFIN